MIRATEGPLISRRLLQVAVGVGGLVPVGAGLAGVVLGARMTGGAASVDLDSHVRYLSGLLLAIGLAYWAAIPRIESQGRRFGLLTLIVAVGGLARLAGVVGHAVPSGSMLAGLAMELVVTPLLFVWQRRVGRAAGMAGQEFPGLGG